MKNSRLKKCFIYASRNGTADLTFNQPPIAYKTSDSGFIVEFEVDVTRTNVLKIIINNLTDNSHIKIDKILLDGVELNFLNNFTWLVTQHKQIQRQYGWINQNGEFVIKLRQNPISQNYLNYILSLTNQ
jgi:hypothetical protein